MLPKKKYTTNKNLTMHKLKTIQILDNKKL